MENHIRKTIADLASRAEILMDREGFHRDRAEHHVRTADDFAVRAARLYAAINTLREVLTLGEGV